MPPNRQDADLERLRLACQVSSVEAVPKAQEVTTRWFLFVFNFAIFEFLDLVQHDLSRKYKNMFILNIIWKRSLYLRT